MTKPTAEPRKIIIDTDPGQDDGVAILLALASSELVVLGGTAVSGNVPLERRLQYPGNLRTCRSLRCKGLCRWSPDRRHAT